MRKPSGNSRLPKIALYAATLLVVTRVHAQFVLRSPAVGGTVCNAASQRVIKVTVDNLTSDGILKLSIRKTNAQCGTGGTFGNPELRTGGRIEIREGSRTGRAVAAKDYAYGDSVVPIEFRPPFETSFRDYYAVVSSDPNAYWDGPVSVRSFDEARTTQGVKLYKLACDASVSGCAPDYVVEVNLVAATVRSLWGSTSGSASAGHLSPRSMFVARRSVAQHWEQAKNSTVGPYIMVNFAFFSPSSTTQTIAFPLKIAGTAISYGYDFLGGASGGGAFPGQYRYIKIDNGANVAEIGTINHTSPQTLPSADQLITSSAQSAGQEFLGGLSWDACKPDDCNVYRPRVFFSTADRTGDGRPELLIYASEKATHASAARMLEHFKGSKLRMLQADGGGSAHLVVDDPYDSTYVDEATRQTVTISKGKILVRGDGGVARTVPHVVAVYPGTL